MIHGLGRKCNAQLPVGKPDAVEQRSRRRRCAAAFKRCGGIVKIEEQGIAGAQEPVHLTGAVKRKAQPFPGGL